MSLTPTQPLADTKSPRHYDPDEIFRFIVDFKTQHDGNSPAIREICEALNISSNSVLCWHLRALERRGLIRLGGQGKARSIYVVGGRWELTA